MGNDAGKSVSSHPSKGSDGDSEFADAGVCCCLLSSAALSGYVERKNCEGSEEPHVCVIQMKLWK